MQQTKTNKEWREIQRPLTKVQSYTIGCCNDLKNVTMPLYSEPFLLFMANVDLEMSRPMHPFLHTSLLRLLGLWNVLWVTVRNTLRQILSSLWTQLRTVKWKCCSYHWMKHWEKAGGNNWPISIAKATDSLCPTISWPPSSPLALLLALESCAFLTQDFC
jgi:hypothetical protein